MSIFNDLVNIWKKNDLLSQAWDESHEMILLSNKIFIKAIDGLRSGEKTKALKELKKRDKEINSFHKNVRRKVVTHYAVSGNTLNIESGLVLINLVVDIERIGDYTKNILDLAIFSSRPILSEETSENLELIEAAVLSRFSSTISVLENKDAEKAQTLLNSYRKDLGKVSDSIVHDIVSGSFEIKNNISPASVALYARYLKRIGAHLKNITSVVTNPFEMIGYNT
ncbi:MAG: hypothetical protein CMG04_06320 [Candidatus Marinimicrobia bacterium]|nr:hypothetical protein [Candidatus Neomarinimicrobiota bacterium]